MLVGKHKTYGIKGQRGTIEGLASAIRKMDALPDAIRAGTRKGLEIFANRVLMRAKANAASVDPLIVNALKVEIQQHGDQIHAVVYVDSGPYGNVPMPVFQEMGTGPQGINSTGGPNGPKYPLPSSAYTQEPWFYWDAAGEHTYNGQPGLVWSDGMQANPYLWPAIQAESPYAKQIVLDEIRAATKRLMGGG